jgi:glycine cleavage system H protein
LSGAPGTVNSDPESGGWFIKLKVANRADVDSLMDETAYKAFLETI